MDVRLRSLEDALSAYKIEYDDQMANWRALDTKAQGAVAVAGLFVGGLLAFAKDPRSEPTLGRIVLVLAVVCLLGAVLFALNALRVCDVADPPSGAIHSKLAEDLASLDEAEASLPARQQGYLGDRAVLWSRTERDTRVGNERKAKSVARAQGLLVAAVLLVGGYTVARIIAG